MEKTTSTGVWIDDFLFDIEDFNLNDILIYSMISTLGNNENGCFASNSYFAKRLKKNNDTVRRSITKLFNLNYITYEVNYNYKSNRILRVTNKATTYLKSLEGLLKNKVVPLVVISNNNKIENKTIISTTSTTKEKLESNLNLLNSLCKKHKLEKEYVLKFITEFIEHNNDIKKVWIDETDLYKHFKSALAIKFKSSNSNNSPKDSLNNNLDIEESLKWFIDMFNKVSKREYLITPVLGKRFKQQLENGFSGERMRLAVENLYSSNFKNKFHIDSGFKFATPEYLLKDDNLNKYANLKYGNVTRAKRIG